MPKIHPMAVVESGAELADDVTVGPFAYIGPHVKLGQGCIVHHHAQIEGHTTAGENNEFFPNSMVGGVSQDLKYRGGPCQVILGNRNKIRENVTIHIGTEDGGGITRIGDNNLIMVGAHIAHDCQLGSNIILANNVMLAGHVLLEDWVIISGGSGSHHFVRFGQHSFIGGNAGITRDVPPSWSSMATPAKYAASTATDSNAVVLPKSKSLASRSPIACFSVTRRRSPRKPSNSNGSIPIKAKSRLFWFLSVIRPLENSVVTVSRCAASSMRKKMKNNINPGDEKEREPWMS